MIFVTPDRPTEVAVVVAEFRPLGATLGTGGVLNADVHPGERDMPFGVVSRLFLGIGRLGEVVFRACGGFVGLFIHGFDLTWRTRLFTWRFRYLQLFLELVGFLAQLLRLLHRRLAADLLHSFGFRPQHIGYL